MNVALARRVRALLALVLALALAVACAPALPASPATAVPTQKPVAPSEQQSPVPAGPTEAPTRLPAPPANPTPAQARQPQVADFYRGKTVRIVVGTSAGGGFDIVSRLLAERLPVYLPGQPTVIVENRPGAGGMLAANTVYTTDPKDGTVVLSFVSSIILRQLLGQPGVNFDAGKFHWLGATDQDASACVVRAEMGVRSIQDTMSGREVVLGTGGQGNDSHDVPAVLAAELGARFKLVPGYAGFSQMQLALENREIDGFCVSFKSLLTAVPQWLEGEQPFARVFAIMGDTTPDHPAVRGLVPAERLARTEESRQLMRLVNAGQRINKPYAVAPEVPFERVQALRSALAATYQDPELLARAEKARIAVNPLSGEQVTDYVQGLLRTPQPLLERLQQISGP